MESKRSATQAMARPIVTLSWEDCRARLAALGIDKAGNLIYGVPRGGLCAAALLQHARVTVDHNAATHVLDDIIDSGATRERLQRQRPHVPFVALVDKQAGDKGLGWVVFPWEAATAEQPAEDGVRRMLQAIGEDPNRNGLLDTPKRVVRAMREMTLGYTVDPAQVLARTFEETADEMVVLSGIEFVSLCEHHLLPFTGTATVAYIPGQNIVGISKLARLVECFARRLQVQERMTQQIADAIEAHLKPRGAAVVVSAHHHCMGCRGVRKPSAAMHTSSLRGILKTDPSARAEFLALARTTNGRH